MNYTGLGAGTELDPYQITTAEEFQSVEGATIRTPVFTGTGLNNLIMGGAYTGGVTPSTWTFTVIARQSILSIQSYCPIAQAVGYAIGDTMTVNGGTPGSLALLTVYNVTSGYVYVNVTDAGKGYTVSNNNTTTTVTGEGSGLLVNILSLTLNQIKQKKDAGEELTYNIRTSFFNIGDGLSYKHDTLTGQNDGDVWTVNIEPKTHCKVMNNIDFGGTTELSSVLGINNFYGSIDGNNKELLGLNGGHFIQIRSEAVVKNLTFRITNRYLDGAHGYVFVAGTVVGITLTGIKVITEGIGILTLFTSGTFDNTSVINNIVLEGNIQNGFSGTINGLIEHVKVLRTTNVTTGKPSIVNNLKGEMRYCQHIALGLEYNYEYGGSLLVDTFGDSAKITESFAHGFLSITLPNPETSFTSSAGLIKTSSVTYGIGSIDDSYIKGSLSINGGEYPGTGASSGKSGFAITPGPSTNVNRCIANLDLNTPLNDNRAVFTQDTNIKAVNNFYKRSAIKSITTVDVTGRQTGLTDLEYVESTNYTGFDFDTIWIMGTEGPELRNNPLYVYETPMMSCFVRSTTRLSGASFNVELQGAFADSYGADIYQSDVLITTLSGLSGTITIPLLDLVYEVKPFYYLGGIKTYGVTHSYTNWALDIALAAPTINNVIDSVVLSLPDPADLVHGSLIYDGYIYGVTRGNSADRKHGKLVRAPLHNVQAYENITILTTDVAHTYNGFDYSRSMEQIVECEGYLYFLFSANFPQSVSNTYLCQYNPSINDYKVFLLPVNLAKAVEPIITDGVYLYFSDYYSDTITKIKASKFVGNFPKYNSSEPFIVAYDGVYDGSSQGGYIAGGYDSILKGGVHSAVIDAEYLYVAYTTSYGTDSGYYASLDISCHEMHKIRMSDMLPAGFVKIPKSTDDCTQNATHIFFGHEVQGGADPRAYGYAWGAYAVRKSDLRLTGLPKLNAKDRIGATTSYASLIFGNYLFDVKTNKQVYILDISDVDNWSVDELIGQRTVKSYQFNYNDFVIPRILNELMVAPDGTFYAFGWGIPSDLMEIEILDLNVVSAPVIETNNASKSGNAIILSGFEINSGGKVYTARGFKYSTDPTALTNIIASAETTQTFTATIPELPEGTYYYQAYQINSEGESSAEVKSFIIEELLSIPEITTSPAVKSGDNMLLQGFLISDGGSPITSRGFRYGTAENALTSSITSEETTSTFTGILSGLAPATYYYQAYAINSTGESSAEVKSFIIEDLSSQNYHWRFKIVFTNGYIVYGKDNIL